MKKKLRAVSVAVLLGVVAIAEASTEPALARGCGADSAADTENMPIRWDEGLLSFPCARLADVIAEYNRHASVKLAISDAELADALVGGALRTGDTETFAAGLQRILRLRVERRGDTVWLISVLDAE
jgi:ferric-dicitrate binding protein FerR (iron transport regulator)